jgi:hypothetical protein
VGVGISSGNTSHFQLNIPSGYLGINIFSPRSYLTLLLPFDYITQLPMVVIVTADAISKEREIQHTQQLEILFLPII